MATLLLAAGFASSSSARTASITGRAASSGNGVASESASAILKASTEAVESLKSMVISGAGEDGGTRIGLDLTLEAGVGSRGSISLSGNTLKIVVLDGEVYLNGGVAFWKANANAATAALVANKWLKAPSTGSLASFKEFGSLTELFNSLFSSHGKLAKSAKTTMVRGIAAIGLVDTTHDGTLYVATKGEPYPLELVNTSRSGGTLTFTDFNAPVKITAPAGAIDLSTLKSGA